MKPKEYLVSIGELKEIGRGRLSLAHIEMCKEAAAKGVSIEGYNVSTAAPVAGKENAPVVTKVSVTNEKVVSDLPDYRYTEDEFRAYELRDGKKVTRSLREACRFCRVSLVVCMCAAPEIVALDARGSVRVYVERK